MTIEEMIKAVKEIQELCNTHCICNKDCPFRAEDGCILAGEPNEWDLTEV